MGIIELRKGANNVVSMFEHLEFWQNLSGVRNQFFKWKGMFWIVETCRNLQNLVLLKSKEILEMLVLIIKFFSKFYERIIDVE